jgi:protein BCP1
MVDVQFDFFDPNPKVDYQALKRLLMQLFQCDAERLHLNDLTDLILSQPTVGTTIKTDGIDSDPFAVLTVLNMHVHQVCVFSVKNNER